jgi:thiamine transporter
VRSERTRLLVEIALTVALSAVLSVFAVRLPINFAGGTISLSMVPILVLALRRGVFPGVIAGVMFGCVDYLIEPFFVAPMQVLLDYPIAFGAVGFAGLGSTPYRRACSVSPARGVAVAVPFIILGGAARFAAAWLSGVVFFGQYAPAGQPVWLYSLGYNLSYMVPSIVLCIAVAAVVLPAVELAVPSASRPAGSSA